MNVRDEAPNSEEPEREKPIENDTPLEAMTQVIRQHGRWLVMLNVPTWDGSDDKHPVENHWKRINDYATEQEARVAASWIERSANRTIRRPFGA